ncbi:MAG: DCC1-like thiol-disulfide oxidoreductase family protein [Leptolyngbyaceae cyanobacterium]
MSSATLALVVQQYLNYWVTGRSLGFFFLADDRYPLALLNSIFGTASIIGLLLLLVPIQADIFRYVVVLLFVGIHSVAFFFLGQPISSALLAITLWLVFIPRSIWVIGERAIDTPERAGLAIYYDADCGFCKKVVHVLRTLLILPGTPLTTAQSDPSICQDMETYNSWVVVDWTQKRHFKFEAIAYICSLSPLFHGLAPVLRWSPIMAGGTRFYETIANNRKKAALFTKFLTFKARPVTPSKLENLVVGILLIAVVIISSHRVLAN